MKYRFVSAFVYDLPFGKDQHFGANASGILGALVSGWQVNGIVTFQSGYPLLFSQGSNNVNLFNPTQRPTWTGTDATLSGQERGDAILKWFDTTQYSVTPAFRFGNTPRVTDAALGRRQERRLLAVQEQPLQRRQVERPDPHRGVQRAEPDALQRAEHGGRFGGVRHDQRRRRRAPGPDRLEDDVLTVGGVCTKGGLAAAALRAYG